MSIYRNIIGMMSALVRLRRREFWPRARLQAHQNAALARLRAHAYTHSRFYQQFHGGLTDRPLHELPVLTKSLLNEHFDQLVTDPSIKRDEVAAHASKIQSAELFRNRYFVNTTSGTTGDSTYILYSQAEWATTLASFTRFERHVGSLWGLLQRPKMAVIASNTPWHISARIGTTVRSSVLPMLRLDVGDPIASIVEQLNDWQPRLLATYASMAGILAEEQLAGRLQIAPQRVVSSAEVLSPTLRTRISQAFGDKVFNQYGATEGGTFAVECESPYAAPLPPASASGSDSSAMPHQRGLHLFEDLYIFEVVDERNRPVPAGEYGDKVLLTVLFNHTQPLIRYELSDRIRLSPELCSCGRGLALIDDIEGRREETLHFPHIDTQASRSPDNPGDQPTVPAHPMVFYRILDATPVHGWQVIQRPQDLCLRLSGDPARVDEQALKAQMRQTLARLGAVPPSITVEWAPDVARGATGKASRIRRATREHHHEA